MAIVQHLSALALGPLLRGLCEAAGIKLVGELTESAVSFLYERFSDHSQKLAKALDRANQRAWRALEVSLAGESLWNLLDRSEERAFRRQLKGYLDALPLAGLPADGLEFRHQCLLELRTARRAGILVLGNLDAPRLAEEVGAFARFADPQDLLDAEWQAVQRMAADLQQAGYPSLARLLTSRAGHDLPLLVIAVRYFLRREVEDDPALFQGLAFAKMERLSQAQEAGFACLTDAITQSSQRLEVLLDELRLIVAETHQVALDIQEEQERQGSQARAIYQEVICLGQRLDLLRRGLRSSDSLSIRSESERRLISTLVARYRSLPDEQRRQLPALLNAIGKLEVVTGEFDAAQRDFAEVAALVVNTNDQAEAFFNCYQTALERSDWAGAIEAYRQTVKLDPMRFSLFPSSKYEPERILGAGGFGVVFLCRNRHSESRVVVKALRSDGIDRTVADVFREAQVLEKLDHPAIIRLRDCDYADTTQARPFLVMDFFDGATLAEYVKRHGPMEPHELKSVALQMAAALAAAHKQGVLHRDIKPANVLIRREDSGWQVKLIDFGLALRQNTIHATASNPSTQASTRIGYSVVGTLEFAAPEQIGHLPGVAVGTYSDIYGFAKTCCYALFQTGQPRPQHWNRLPRPLVELLDSCLAVQPNERVACFADVIEHLQRIVGEDKRPDDVNDEERSGVRYSAYGSSFSDQTSQTAERSNADERTVWLETQQKGTKAAYQQYLKTFPAGVHVTTARRLIDEIDWQAAERQGTREAYEHYLWQQSNGGHVFEARSRLQEQEDEQTWKILRERGTEDAYQQYLAAHPNGRNKQEAKQFLDQAEAARLREKLLRNPRDSDLRCRYLALRSEALDRRDRWRVRLAWVPVGLILSIPICGFFGCLAALILEGYPGWLKGGISFGLFFVFCCIMSSMLVDHRPGADISPIEEKLGCLGGLIGLILAGMIFTAMGDSMVATTFRVTNNAVIGAVSGVLTGLVVGGFTGVWVLGMGQCKKWSAFGPLPFWSYYFYSCRSAERKYLGR